MSKRLIQKDTQTFEVDHKAFDCETACTIAESKGFPYLVGINEVTNNYQFSNKDMPDEHSISGMLLNPQELA